MHDDPVPIQTRQRLRANTAGGKVLRLHHGTAAQQFEGLGALGGVIADVRLPLLDG